MAIEYPKTHVDYPFTVPANREEVTREPEALLDRQDPRYPDVSWDNAQSLRGGGHVPEDYEWTSNPKEHQDALMGEWPHAALERDWPHEPHEPDGH